MLLAGNFLKIVLAALDMPWQLSCHGMCKIFTWSDLSITFHATTLHIFESLNILWIFKNQEIAKKQWWNIFDWSSLDFKILNPADIWRKSNIIVTSKRCFPLGKFNFHQSESCVLTMSSWSKRVKSLHSSIKVHYMHYPTGSVNLKKMLYFYLCVSFMSC